MEMIELQNGDENDTNDPESALQMELSVLADQEDLFLMMVKARDTTNTDSNNPTTPKAFLDWMIQALSETGSSKHMSSDSIWNSWRLKVSNIAVLLPKLSPFELHSVASEMVWMATNDNSTGGSVTYPCFCLILCIHALQQAPSPTITRRSKRWQSLLCETIRQFQIHWERATSEEEDDDDDDSTNDNKSTNAASSPLVIQLWIQLWCQHVVPAALKVLTSLPSDSSKVAIKCGLIATATQLASFCSTDTSTNNNNDTDTTPESLLQILYKSFKSVLAVNTSSTTNGGSKDDEMDFWMYPWYKHDAEASGKYSAKESTTDSGAGDEEDQWGDDDNEHDDLQAHRDDSIWWATQAQHHEHVVGMNTLYDDIGLATLACYEWEDRPHVLTPSQIWKVWLPHVKFLLLSSGGVFGRQIGFMLFDRLLKSTPPGSITWKTTNETSSPGSPLPIFHLLSNRMLVLSRPDIEDSQQRADLKRQTDQMIFWIKNLLYCYQPIDQVDMVQKLVQDCPYPAVQAMFLDSLRPLILKDDNREVTTKFWMYIGSLLETLQTKYMPDGTLVEVEDLIDQLEIFIGSIAMLQLYVLAKKSLPRTDTKSGGMIQWEGQLKDCHHAITKTLQLWETKSPGSLPPGAFRLNLLEVSISEILRFTKENDGGTQV